VIANAAGGRVGKRLFRLFFEAATALAAGMRLISAWQADR